MEATIRVAMRTSGRDWLMQDAWRGARALGAGAPPSPL